MHFSDVSSMMDFVRLMLALALVLHLSGVPAVVASPCAAASSEASDCCANHQQTERATVIGGCACQATATADARDAVSVAPGSSDRHDNGALVELPFIPAPGAWADSDSVSLLPISLETSPPLLSATGFRC